MLFRKLLGLLGKERVNEAEREQRASRAHWSVSSSPSPEARLPGHEGVQGECIHFSSDGVQDHCYADALKQVGMGGAQPDGNAL